MKLSIDGGRTFVDCNDVRIRYDRLRSDSIEGPAELWMRLQDHEISIEVVDPASGAGGASNREHPQVLIDVLEEGES